MELEPPIRRIEWNQCWRIIPSRYPPIQLFERVSSKEDLDTVMELESMTNERLREQAGEINLVEPEDRVFGAGTGYIMAAFTHLNPDGSRFSDGSFGVYYAGKELRTAIEESKYHRECFMASTRESPMILEMRVLVARLASDLHDLRNAGDRFPSLFDPNDYTAGQILGKRLRIRGSWGVVYPSVRHEGGICAGIFRPRALSECKQERHLAYHWDGEKITTVRKLSQK